MILREDKEIADKHAVVIHPSVEINGHEYRGDLDADDVFPATCSSFKSGTAPEVCKKDYDI